MGWEPLLESVGVCLAREMKARSDRMALGTSSGCTLLFGGREAVVLVEGCWFLCTSSPSPSTSEMAVAVGEDKSN